MSADGWVILATDTGVGKTHIGCALLDAARRCNQPLMPLKPVETGCRPVHTHEQPHTRQPLWPADGAALHQACEQAWPLDAICPLRFATPVAAPEAARLEQQALLFQRDLTPLLAQTDNQPRLIETAGGVYSPICEDALNIDIARHTQLPVLLITPDRLGTLSSTLSAMQVILHQGLTLDRVILNPLPVSNDAYPPDNFSALTQWAGQLFPDWGGQIIRFAPENHALDALFLPNQR